MLIRPHNFRGIIIEESLGDPSVLHELKILSTRTEPVTENHKTPWVKQWTMHEVEIEDGRASEVAKVIRDALDRNHHWYADYKTDSQHYIIYRDAIFHVTDRSDKSQYDRATAYGISIGIPDYQVDFAPHVKHWVR